MKGHSITWLRRSVGIPRGFLSYAVLIILKHKPMSGSELMREFEKWTGWTPSPGSIYPLLRKYRDEGVIESVESEEIGLKRVTLTEKGKELLKEYGERDVFREKFHSMRRMWLKIHKEMDEDLHQASVRLFETIEKIASLLKGEEAREDAAESQSILIKTVEELEKIIIRLESGKGGMT